jgi:1,4-dihydroxy-6-naphthoate synthase
MSLPIRLGFSPCPNDIFAYGALLDGQVDLQGLSFDLQIQDVETLNQDLSGGRLDVAKASFAAVLDEPRRWTVLPVGAALGFGVGPLLVARAAALQRAAEGIPAIVVAPGEHTTATLLFRLFHREILRQRTELRQVPFSEVFPALERGEADYGVCIHEGRFTYREHGLSCVADLGECWERASGLPLPLGGMIARQTLGSDLLARTCAVLRSSLRWAHAHPAQALETMRSYAQELDDPTIQAHVRTYVSAATDELGPEGARSLAELRRRAFDQGLARAEEDLSIFAPPEGTYPRRLFHVLRKGHWDPAADPFYAPDSLAEQGFIHLSFAEQLPGTLLRHFRSGEELLLLEAGLGVDAAESKLRMEPSPRGELYPHLYRPLGRGEILRGWRLRASGAGHALPVLGESTSGDNPQGLSLSHPQLTL